MVVRPTHLTKNCPFQFRRYCHKCGSDPDNTLHVKKVARLKLDRLRITLASNADFLRDHQD